jgi:hypothetical protein
MTTITEPRVRDRRVHLRIKIAELNAEARYIRKQEGKSLRKLRGKQLPRPTCIRDASPEEKAAYRVKLAEWKAGNRPKISEATADYHRWLRSDLHNHRVTVLRTELRCCHLAYAFIRGKTYREAESSTREGNSPLTLFLGRPGMMYKHIASIVTRFDTTSRHVTDVRKTEIAQRVWDWIQAAG